MGSNFDHNYQAISEALDALAELRQMRDEQRAHRAEQAAHRARVEQHLAGLADAITRLRRCVEVMVAGAPSDIVEERPCGPLH
jgi:hypothetical protein